METPLAEIRNLPQLKGRTVRLRGWVWNRRGSGRIRFAQLRDGTGFAQLVAGEQDLDAESFELLKRLSQESLVEAEGTVAENGREALGVELRLSALRQLSGSEDYPITHKEHGTDFLMDRRHLWLRSPRQRAILAIRDRMERSIHAYFHEQGFLRVDAPIFTDNACEGTTTLFSAEYFGSPAYLSQSGQLYMEAAAAAVGKAYCFGPTFRAENSNTRRHLTEFWMVEPEAAFMELPEDMALGEGLIKRIVADVLDECRPELALLGRDLAPLRATAGCASFPRLAYDDAVEVLKKNGAPDFRWGDDFGGPHETIIAQQYSTPVIVHRYPCACKAFYMKKDPVDARLSLSMDILAPEGYGEIVGGGERETDLETLLKGFERHGIAQTTLDWYLDLRKYGTFPHSGFGLGVERTLAWICGLPHVRETSPFPRLPGRLHP